MFPQTFCLDGKKTFFTRRKLRALLFSCVGCIFVASSPIEFLPVSIRALVETLQSKTIETLTKYVRSPRQHPLLMVIWSCSGCWLTYLLGRTFNRTFTHDFFDRSKLSLLKFAYRWIPAIRAQCDKEFYSAQADMKKSLLKPINGPVFDVLPREGLSNEEVSKLIAGRTAGERDEFCSGKVSGAVYFNNEEREKFLAKVHGDFGLYNMLHPELFPSVRQMEAEIVSMVAAMLNGNEQTVGCVTSGGTESLLMAVKCYRDCARDQKGIFNPEMIVADSVHAAFDKAENYFDVKINRVPIDLKTGEMDLDAVKSAVNSNTILIVGSAPNYPTGTMDNIPALAKIAKNNNVGLHVDCCLGSFIMPHQKMAGFETPYPFDFSVDGVTSISCDTHKFGFAPKGTSVILYKDSVLRSYQFFTCPGWMGGIYASPSVAGSRPGAAVAAAWAALLTMGQSGYIDAAKKTLTCARTIANAIRNGECGENTRNEIELFGRSDSTVVALKSKTLPIHAIGEALKEVGGWHLNNLQNPNAIHICCTLSIAGNDPVGKAKQFLNDLDIAVGECEKRRAELSKRGGAALYGVAATVPQGLVAALTKVYFDVSLMLSQSKKV